MAQSIPIIQGGDMNYVDHCCERQVPGNGLPIPGDCCRELSGHQH